MQHGTRPSILIPSLLFGAWTAAASAQWSLVNLHPTETNSSFAVGVSGGQQAGNCDVGHNSHASVWNGSASSWVDLNPIGTLSSRVYGQSNGRQVGDATAIGGYHAMLWSGTAASMIDLTPAGAYLSSARAISGNQQVGTVSFPTGGQRAALWSGTAASFVDLGLGNPLGTDGTHQVGQYGGNHAVMWSGTAASRVDLNPIGLPVSIAYAVQGGQQVGSAVQTGQSTHAALWSGTAASYVNLNPANSLRSEALGVWGGFQVGYAQFGNNRHAGIWNGTAGSWVDLHAFVPAGFAESVANGIWSDGVATYVVGYGNHIEGSSVTEALMWQVPAPSGLVPLVAGVLWAAGRRRRRAAQGAPALTQS